MAKKWLKLKLSGKTPIGVVRRLRVNGDIIAFFIENVMPCKKLWLTDHFSIKKKFQVPNIYDFAVFLFRVLLFWN